MAVKLRNPKFATADFVKFIRSNYTPPKDIVYEPSFISQRSENEFSVAKPRDFHTSYRRRLENRQKSGFFCPQDVPYQPLGELVLDTNRLVLDSLDGSVNEQAVKNHEKSKDPRATPFAGDDKQKRKTPEQPDDDVKNDWEKRKFASQSAGMQYIRELIREAEGRITSVKAGQSYELNVLQCKSDKHRAREMEEDNRGQDESMSMTRLSSHFLLDNVPTYGVPFGDDVFTGGEACGYSRKFTLAKNDEIVMIKSKVPELERKQNPRKIKAFRKRLKLIYNVLCMMCNVKTKMLRQRNPLNHPTVRSLQKDPFARANTTKGRRSGPRRSVSVGVKILQTQPSNEQQLVFHGGRDSITQSGRSLLHSRQGLQSRQSCFKPTTDGTSGGAGGAVNRETRRRLLLPGKNEREDTPSRLENWEDLLNVSTKKQNRVPRKLPPWFQSLAAGEKSNKSDTEKTHDTEDHSDVCFLHKFKTDMIVAREAIQSRAKFANTKIESEKLPKFRMKMSLLEPDRMRPLWEQQRKMFEDVNKKDIKDVECVQDKYPFWYEDLLGECTHLYVDDDRDISKIMQALEMFAKEDIQSLPNAKEKLCLVTLSLPVFEICTAPVQQAIKFVLTDVLGQKNELMEEWMKYRKLYII